MADSTTVQDDYTARLGVLVQTIRTFLALIAAVDLDGLLDTVSRIEAVAPVLEPTAYIRGGGRNLADQAALLRAASEFRAALRKLMPDQQERP